MEGLSGVARFELRTHHVLGDELGHLAAGVLGVVVGGHLDDGAVTRRNASHHRKQRELRKASELLCVNLSLCFARVCIPGRDNSKRP